MENEQNALVPVPNKTGMIALELRLHSVADNMAMANKTFHDATDKILKVRSETVVGFASLILTFTLLAVGSILLGPTPAGIAAGFSYFPWVGLIALCCAFMSALIIQHKSSFDGGELSFRSVLIWMYCSTSLVCDGAAVYVHGGLTAQPSWADPVTVNWYLMCGTIATLCFALIYVLYARNITMDRIRVEGNNRRRWSARKAIGLVGLISIGCMVWNTVEAGLCGIDLPDALLVLIVSFLAYVCAHVFVEMQMNLNIDRGIQ